MKKDSRTATTMPEKADGVISEVEVEKVGTMPFTE